MALVANGYGLDVTLTDQGGNDTTRSYDLKGADIAEATTNAADVMAALANVTDAKIKAYSIRSKFIDNAFALPTGGVQVENQAKIGLTINGLPNKKGYVTIPAPKDTIFQGASGAAYNQVDFADLAVIAFVDLFTTGGVAYLSDGEEATTVNPVGKRIHVKSNKG